MHVHMHICMNSQLLEKPADKPVSCCMHTLLPWQPLFQHMQAANQPQVSLHALQVQWVPCLAGHCCRLTVQA